MDKGTVEAMRERFRQLEEALKEKEEAEERRKSTLNPATDAHINSKMKDLEAKLSGG